MRPFLILLACLTLVACGEKPKSEPPAKPDAGILEGQRQAMERAKGVGGTLEQGAGERKEKIDQESAK